MGLFSVVMGGGMVYNNPIGTNKIEKNKVKKKKANTETKTRKMLSMPDKFKSLCCKKVRKTIIFKSQQTKKNMILQNVNYASTSI